MRNLKNLLDSFPNTEKMPALFIGHGSPMNAIEENEFVAKFREVGKNIPRPTAVLCISAHWQTSGTQVTAMSQPKTIHDFGGFPKALYEVEYPASGSPELAETTQSLIGKNAVELDYSWGFDHGSWTVLRHMYPDASIPIIELSLDYRKSPKEHYELAKKLAVLRKKGILILGSGNLVHNLRQIAWRKFNEDDYAYDWAREAQTVFNNLIENRNHDSLISYQKLGTAAQLAVPTPEHYLPLLYVLASQESTDELQFFNDKAVAGSLTMTSVKLK